MANPTPPPSQLLFAVLAMNNTFVNRAQFFDAVSDWMRQPQTPLPDLLARRGNLDEDERLTLGRLLNKCVKRHGGPQQALEVLLDPYLRFDLNALLSGQKPNASPSANVPTAFDPFATLPPGRDGTLPTIQTSPVRPAPVPTARPNPMPAPAPTVTAPFAPPMSVPPPPPPAPPVRYKRTGPPTREGFSETSTAHDEELNREVILREVVPSADARQRARFLREAEIAGHLEHPGVVPVYGLGNYSDGRPYYAMRLVKGRTLGELIERFHSPDSPHRDPPAYQRVLRSLLVRFIAVCDVVGYAHSRGIIHRHLEPATIRVGEYGETLVMDWSVARPYDRPDRYAMTASQYVRVNNDLSSEGTGHVVGSPGYVSPEQAHGIEVGPASDVWALGAILYEILTGQGPYAEGATPAETLELARVGVVTPARRLEPKAPRALEAVCKKAMAPQPKDRYPSTRELAAEIERFLSDEPLEVYPEPMGDRLGRWGARNRSLLAILVVLAFTAILALCVLFAVVAFTRRPNPDRTESSGEPAALRVDQSRAAERWPAPGG